MLAERIVQQTVDGPVVWDSIFDSHVTLLMKSEFRVEKDLYKFRLSAHSLCFNVFQKIDLVNDLLAWTTSITQTQLMILQ